MKGEGENDKRRSVEKTIKYEKRVANSRRRGKEKEARVGEETEGRAGKK